MCRLHFLMSVGSPQPASLLSLNDALKPRGRDREAFFSLSQILNGCVSVATLRGGLPEFSVLRLVLQCRKNSLHVRWHKAVALWGWPCWRPVITITGRRECLKWVMNGFRYTLITLSLDSHKAGIQRTCLTIQGQHNKSGFACTLKKSSWIQTSIYHFSRFLQCQECKKRCNLFKNISIAFPYCSSRINDSVLRKCRLWLRENVLEESLRGRWIFVINLSHVTYHNTSHKWEGSNVCQDIYGLPSQCMYGYYTRAV